MLEGFVDDLFRRHGFSAGRIEDQLADIWMRHIRFQFAQQCIDVDNTAAGRHDMFNEPNEFFTSEFCHAPRIRVDR